MTPALIAQIKADEGLRLHPYVDTVGKTTIGYGRNLTDRGISAREADYLLDNDVADAVTSAERYPWFAGLSELRQMVIVSMLFNLGPVGFAAFTKLIAALQRMDYESAADEIVDSKAGSSQAKIRYARFAQFMREG